MPILLVKTKVDVDFIYSEYFDINQIKSDYCFG